MKNFLPLTMLFLCGGLFTFSTSVCQAIELQAAGPCVDGDPRPACDVQLTCKGIEQKFHLVLNGEKNQFEAYNAEGKKSRLYRIKNFSQKSDSYVADGYAVNVISESVPDLGCTSHLTWSMVVFKKEHPTNSLPGWLNLEQEVSCPGQKPNIQILNAIQMDCTDDDFAPLQLPAHPKS